MPSTRAPAWAWCLAVVCLCAAARGDTRPDVVPASAAVPTQLDGIYANCVDDMLKNTCVAKNDRDEAPATRNASASVIVAGVGRIDAASYQAIRAYGESMCARVRASCAGDAGGTECRTAVALWGGPAAR